MFKKLDDSSHILEYSSGKYDEDKMLIFATIKGLNYSKNFAIDLRLRRFQVFFINYLPLL